MLRAGYDPKLAAGVTCAGGCLGILIPPSIMLILYGATAGVSVVQLYAAAFIPGVTLAMLYIIYAIAIGIIRPEMAPRLPPEERNVPALKILWALATSFLPLALLIASVLGSIIMGLATPSEAAAVGSLGSIVLAIVYRAFTWQKLKESVFLTARTSAMVCWLFVGSYIFSSVFGYLGGQSLVEEFVKSLPLNTFTFLLLAQVIIFILGWPLEWTEIIVIFVPIFLPLLDDFGVSPIFFGILIALNLQTSFLSPPVAMAAFYLKGVAPPHVKLEDIFKGCMPFIYIVIFCMIMVYIFPGLVTWLPELLYSHAPADPGSVGLIDSPPAGGFQEVEEISLPPLN
jgi:tripartite ATP-independent transporter DctM subunit